MNEFLQLHTDDFIRLVIALLIGAVVGTEREYRSKAAGLRTMILICAGSALFTMLSLRIGHPGSPDRIASNIITGIGFIGAGAIFRDGISVTGLTTASTIWVTAALGMAVGAGEIGLGLVGMAITLVVLAVLERLQIIIDNLHQRRNCGIKFNPEQVSKMEIEEGIRACGLKFKIRKISKEEGGILYCLYDLQGRAKNHEVLSAFLLNHPSILQFEF
jgi:putative Mg2+ transporter-C (MgtC) family protein